MPQNSDLVSPRERLERTRERLRPYWKPEDDWLADLFVMRSEDGKRD